MGQTTEPSETPGTAQDYLDESAVTVAVEGLSVADRLKLDRIERRLLNGTDFAQGDIVHEAFYRALALRKLCPVGVPFMAFLIKSMTNIAYHARGARIRGFRDLSIAAEVDERIAVGGLTPGDLKEREAAEEECDRLILELESFFANDEDALFLLEAWKDGLKGKALRETLGWDERKVDTVTTRVKRKARAGIPKGRTT